MRQKTNPWKDIAPYLVNDTHSFRGRGDDLRRFLNIIDSSHFSVIYAESGIGKTSFINAAVFPELSRMGFACVRIVFPTDVLQKRHDNPRQYIESWLIGQIFGEKHLGDPEASRFKDSLWWILHSGHAAEICGGIPFLIFDQFEEVFQKAETGNIQALFSIIDELTSETPGKVLQSEISKSEDDGCYLEYDASIGYKILFSLRSEYLATFDYWTNERNSIPELLKNRMILLPFTEEQAKEIITEQVMDGERVSVFDDICDDILTLFRNKDNASGFMCEAFLLSVVCSRLYEQAGNAFRLSRADIAEIDLKGIVMAFYDERIAELSIPRKHMNVIEDILVDEFGKRNRINVESFKLNVIGFKDKYLQPLENSHIIRCSSDGYVELIHDRIAEVVFSRRRNERIHSLALWQRVGVVLFVVLSFLLVLSIGWSSPVGNQKYITQEVKYAYKAKWPEDYADTNDISHSWARTLVIDTDKRKSGSVFVSDCPWLEEVQVMGKQRCNIYISRCPSLVNLELSDSLSSVPDIDDCPNLNYISLPENFLPTRIYGNCQCVFDVPEKISNKIWWSDDGVLWDLEKKKILYARADAESEIIFPDKVDEDSISFRLRTFHRINTAGAVDYKINGNTLEKAYVHSEGNVTIDFNKDERLRTIKEIGKSAFANCSKLESVIFSESVRTIHQEAFFNCENLKQVVFPEKISSINIGNWAFYGCKSIDTLMLPKNAALGSYVFSGCSNLKVLRLPDSIESFFKGVGISRPYDLLEDKDGNCIKKNYTIFDGCDKLSEVIVDGDTVNVAVSGKINYHGDDLYLGTGAFASRSDSVMLYKDEVPLFCIGKSEYNYEYIGHAYVFNPEPKVYVGSNRIIFRNDLSKLKELHISNCMPLEHITLPESVKAIVTLYVPWHCRKYYVGVNSVKGFRSIKEDSFFRRLLNQLLDMIAGTLIFVKHLPLLCVLGGVIVLFLFVFSFCRFRKTHTLLVSVLNAFASTIVFTLLWMALYWSIFFILPSSTLTYFIGHAVGIIIAVIVTWVLFFDTKTEVFEMMRLLVQRLKMITFKDVRLYLVSAWNRLHSVCQRIYDRKTIRRVFLIALLLSCISGYPVWSYLYVERIIAGKVELTTARLHRLGYCMMISKSHKAKVDHLLNEKCYVTDLIKVNSYEEGHSKFINEAVFSPNGEYVLTASDDNTAKLWDARTGAELHTFRHEDDVNSAVFSSDGKYVLTASDDNTAKLWDACTGAEPHTFQHEYGVKSVVFSSDGKYILTASYDTAKLWDACTGAELHRFQHEYVVRSAVFSRDGKYILTASYDTAKLWDARTGAEFHAFRHEHESGVKSVVFSSDGKYILTASYDTAKLWDAHTGAELRTFQPEHEYDVRSAVFSPDGSLILILDEDDNAELWDVKSGEKIHVYHHRYGCVAEFSSDEKYVLHVSANGKSVTVWNLDEDIAPVMTTSSPMDFNGFDYNERNSMVLTFTDAEISVWDYSLCKVCSISGDFKKALISRDGKYILALDKQGRINLYDASTGRQLKMLCEREAVEDACFSADGKAVVTVRDSSVIVVRVDDGMTENELKHTSKISSLMVSPDNRHIITVDACNEVRLWRLDTNECVVLKTLNSRVKSYSFSEDGGMFALCQGKLWSIWDVNSNRLVREIESDNLYEKGIFTSDGRWFITPSWVLDIKADMIRKISYDYPVNVGGDDSIIAGVWGKSRVAVYSKDDFGGKVLYSFYLPHSFDYIVLPDNNNVILAEGGHLFHYRLPSFREKLKKAKLK